jgi:hypothetical protein
MEGPDVRGPVEYLVIEFPAHIEGARSVQALLALADAGTIRLLDVLLVRKGADGAIVNVDLAWAIDFGLAAWSALAPSRSGMLGDEDVAMAAGVLHPGTTAAVVLYENLWAVPFVAAAVDEGGRVRIQSRLSALEAMDQLPAIEKP